MEDLSALQDYLKKIQRTIENADFTILNYKIVKKNRIDDLLVCTLATLPDIFKSTMKKRLKIDQYPSVSSYARLSKLLKKPCPLLSDYYLVNYSQTIAMFKNIKQNLERDIRRLEEM